MDTPDLVLASASPRRQSLLRTLGVAFACRPADIDETPSPSELPQHYVARMAREKALAIAAGSSLPVLAADTTVVCGGEILGKPRCPEEAMQMLAALGGCTHEVYTALCLRHAGRQHERLVVTRVSFGALSEDECAAYIATGEPWDKAGGYAIQGLGGALVERIDGSYSNVVGLPLYETRQLLAVLGIRTQLDANSGGTG